MTLSIPRGRSLVGAVDVIRGRHVETATTVRESAASTGSRRPTDGGGR